jgi:hypothetical protein
MINIPFESLWGVDIAIKKLRPGAHFQLNNRTFEMWYDPEGRHPPSWEEVLFQLNHDYAQAESWATKNKVNFEFENPKLLPPAGNKKYFWNKDDNEWEGEPDFDVE